MRDIRRRIARTPQRLKRSADGRLQPAADDSDIGDIWAEQKRIRLREAILEDQRRAERRERRKQLFRHATRRLRPGRSVAAPSNTHTQSGHGPAKEIEIRLNLPSLKLPKGRAVRRLLARVPRPKVRKKYAILAGSIAAVAVLGLAGWQLFGGKDGQGATAGKGVSRSTLGAAADADVPDYPTVLPEGKTIEALGGWGRVSPPDRDPVFAYADAIGGVRVTVSQQPLPGDFKSDESEKIAALAKQFQANEKLAIEDGAAYVGTSVRGPQSVVASKEALLILIKSTAVIPEDQWVSYLQSLHKAN